MIVHLISGFLGSGKTTAITGAARILMNRGRKCAVVTNDQGNYLIDSRTAEDADIPFAEVSGGCFCCRYDELEEKIFHLKKTAGPEIIFAETVGSCTDLIATVLKPLLTFRSQDIHQITFSTLVDVQLLKLYLEGRSLPFSHDTMYIWEKQMEEAEILIINKTDLLTGKELIRIREKASAAFENKLILYQNSLDAINLESWLDALVKFADKTDHQSIDIDYETYGRGEADLAWLDEEIEITSDHSSALMIAHRIIDRLTNTIMMNGLPVGHLKFFLHYNGQSVKISYSTVLNRTLFRASPPDYCDRVEMMVNARVQTAPELLRAIVEEVINNESAALGITIREKNISFFKPGFPKPVHRME